MSGWVPWGLSFWYHPQCYDHNLNQLMCTTWTLKHKEGLALGQPVLASQAMWIACRMEIAWSISCLRRKWEGVGGVAPRLGWWLWGKGKHPSKLLKSSRCSSVSQQLLCTYRVSCTTKETGYQAWLGAAGALLQPGFSLLFCSWASLGSFSELLYFTTPSHQVVRLPREPMAALNEHIYDITMYMLEPLLVVMALPGLWLRPMTLHKLGKWSMVRHSPALSSINTVSKTSSESNKSSNFKSVGTEVSGEGGWHLC